MASVTNRDVRQTTGGYAGRIPAHRLLPALLRDPMGTFERVGLASGGRVVRLDLGLTRAFLVTHPDDVARVLTGPPGQYRRAGMLWDPLAKLIGTGLGGEDEPHARSRRLVAPLFATKQIAGLVDGMAATVADTVGDWRPTGDGPPTDLGPAMTRLVSRVVIHAFFGSRISPADCDRLGAAIDTAFTSLRPRLLLPFLPGWVPLPGSLAFRRAVRTVDEVAYPLIEAARSGQAAGADIVSLLCRARDADGERLDDRQVRDDLVALYVAGSETTSVALTWLWVVLQHHPEVADRLRRETARLAAPVPGAADLPTLAFTRLVLKELLRLYPTGWLIPRTATGADVLGGVRVPAGATVLLSPYLTHRMPQWWERPTEFDPQRFADGRSPATHRYAYFPFGGGSHQCLGSHVFLVAGQLAVAAVLRRFRVDLVGGSAGARPAASVTLRPDRPVLARLRLVSDPDA